MNITFRYEENESLIINKISVIGSFNNYDVNSGKMEKKDGVWILEASLEPGEHYYKFVINDKLKLNDSTANIYLPHINDEIYSVIMINENDERLYNNTQYTANIEKYNMTGNIYEEYIPTNKKEFNRNIDKKVVTRFQFTNVTGIHAVTAVWVMPNGELFDDSENLLFTPKGEEDKPIDIWFWIDLTDSDRNYQSGRWLMKLFLDGEFILEDEFTLGKANTYSNYGQVKYQ
ncbi:hypothetical protein [Clostridium septicum]|uniref:AMP-activated protein kinase glycogen-binding domain-containing protein n=1 Tax=Clostridium septicum TaxID=1504 RepID=A0A9N7PJT2_CLOSE|nr:hypothetical protein [Clostridium septicum]AYE34980.1 hypothetical protein CP523_11460 [Clostridium septicum]MDU1314629.1 hypothetical protein [Clostridium septicum]QAS60373.1 hypothetical protein EI377_06275 [Clostridium septicum]UEC20371.1 hypothetical protein LK444_13365 [Clostridium septicum]USS01576.1 hypothetical protein NH397_03815 [Clostridium septicum]